MPKIRQRRKLDSEWEEHRRTIEQLYLSERSQLEGDHGVINLMKSRHNFQASKAQYEIRFKKWGLRKNLKKAEWQTIGYLLANRDRMGLPSTVYFNGELISRDKVLKEIARYRDGQYSITESEEPRLPEGVTIEGVSDEIRAEESELADAPVMVTIQDLELFQSPTQSLIMMADNGSSTYQEFDSMELAMQHSFSRYPTHLNSHEPLHDWWDTGSIPAQSPFTYANDNHLAHPNFGVIGFPMPHSVSQTATPLNGEGNPGWLVANTIPLEFRHNFNDTIPLDTLSLIQGLGTLTIRGFNTLMQAIVDRCVTKIIPLLSQRAAQALRIKRPEDQFLQLIILLFMNNFAGSNDVDFEALFQLLQFFTPQQAKRLLDAIPQPYNAALQQSILTIAIKFGARSIVEVLLQRDIDQNAIYCVSKEQTMTPLQFACRLRNFEITRFLIESGADVNRKDNKGFTTMSHLLHIDFDMEATYPPTVGRILALLLNAEADVICEELRHFFFWNTQSVVGVFLKCGRTPEVHHNLAVAAEALNPAFRYLDNDGALAATRILLGHGFIFGASLESRTEEILSSAFSIASSKGHEDVVEFFLKAEFKPTPDSLASAVEGNSMPIVRLLLKYGLKPDSSFEVKSRRTSRPHFKSLQSSFDLDQVSWRYEKTTPCAEAVRFQNKEAIHLFRKEIGSVFNIAELTESKEFLFSNLLNAASEAGDIEMMGNLLHQFNFALPIPDTMKVKQLVSSCFPLATLGHHEVAVGRLLENGVLPEDSSCLLSALIVQDQALVRLFLNLAILPSADPCLMWFAVRWGNLDVIQDLIDAGTILHGYAERFFFLDNEWKLPSPYTNSLGKALSNQDHQVTQLLIKNGAEVGTERSSQFGKISSLTAAAQSGDIYMVQDLLSRGVDPNDPTAFLEAASQSPMMVQAILEAFNSRYQKGKTLLACKALREAIQDSKLAEVSAYAKYTDLNDKFQINEAHFRRYNLRHFLEYPGSILYLPSPLGEAIAGCNLDIIKTIHNNGGAINSTVILQAPVPFRGRWLAIHQAIYTKNLAVVRLVCTLGARANCKAELGITRTPLQLAAELGSYEIVEFLIRHCDADVNAEPCIWDGRTALQLAASLCFVRIAELLIQFGADINAPGGKYEGRTAFEGAAEHGRIEMLLFLSRNGLHLPLDREQACRAMELAAKNGQAAARELVKMISEFSTPSLCGFSPLSIT